MPYSIIRPSRAGIALVVTAIMANAASAETVYLNQSQVIVSVGPGTGPSANPNNTFGFNKGIEKVIDAASADAVDDHSQPSHIWFTFTDPAEGLELIFDFDRSYDIELLHFWNFSAEPYDVDEIRFTFFDSNGAEIGRLTLEPPLGTGFGNRAINIPLTSPLNTRSVSALLRGNNGQIDFQNIGFTARISDPARDPLPGGFTRQ